MTNKQERLERLKAEQRSLALKIIEKTITQQERMRLTMIRDEVRRLVRQFMQRIA